MNIPFIPPIPFANFKFGLGLNFEKNSGTFQKKEVALVLRQKFFVLRSRHFTSNAHTAHQTS